MMPRWKREERARARARGPQALKEFQLLMGKGHCVDCDRITSNMVTLNGQTWTKKEFLCETCETHRGNLPRPNR